MPQPPDVSALASAAAKAKRELLKLTEELEACRTLEKRLLQEQAIALNAWNEAKARLLAETVGE